MRRGHASHDLFWSLGLILIDGDYYDKCGV